MKFTWGHAMMVILAGYMIFILSFVFRLNISELMTEDYYSEEVKYQTLIDAQKNFQSLREKPTIEFVADEIKILFPTKLTSQNVKGNIAFFRPSDAKEDVKIPILLDENNLQRIPTVNLIKGKYYFILDWESNSHRYYTKQTLKIK